MKYRSNQYVADSTCREVCTFGHGSCGVKIAPTKVCRPEPVRDVALLMGGRDGVVVWLFQFGVDDRHEMDRVELFGNWWLVPLECVLDGLGDVVSLKPGQHQPFHSAVIQDPTQYQPT